MKVRIDLRVELASEGLPRARQRIHRGGERDSRMHRRGADHESAGEPKSCDSETKRRLYGAGSRVGVHETQRDAGAPPSLQQGAERAVEKHDVIEPYGASRQTPIRSGLAQYIVSFGDVEAALRNAWPAPVGEQIGCRRNLTRDLAVVRLDIRNDAAGHGRRILGSRKSRIRDLIDSGLQADQVLVDDRIVDRFGA